MTSDGELLRRYAEARSEEAFAELVQRHVNLVYSAALRQVNGNTHLAQEVGQSVFTDLARKAATLSQRPVLTGWLYASTHFAAARAIRTEQRRRAREQEAEAMREWSHDPTSEMEWNHLRTVLDDAMLKLGEADREIILLRYFEQRRLGEIGEKLGLTENAARMRVERALEKLRTRLGRRGIAGSAAALATVISLNAVQAAPAGMAAVLAAASFAGASAAATGAGTFALIHAMTITKLKATIVGAVVTAALATTLWIEHRSVVRLREENLELRDRTDELDGLRDENRRLALVRVDAEELERLRAERSELLRLRADATAARRDREELARLRAQLSAARQVGSADAAPGVGSGAFGNFLALENIFNAGNATPEALMQTLLWSLREGDIKPLEQFGFGSLSDGVDELHITGVLNLMRAMVTNAVGFRLAAEPADEGRLLQVRCDAEARPEAEERGDIRGGHLTFWLERKESGWFFAPPPTTPNPSTQAGN